MAKLTLPVLYLVFKSAGSFGFLTPGNILEYLLLEYSYYAVRKPSHKKRWYADFLTDSPS